jgi:hypothetical protein
MMKRILMCCLLAASLTGCRVPPERDAFTPLPENGAGFSYGELLSRLHAQASAATDAFFVDAWVEMEAAARGIAQTSRFLAKVIDAPEHLRPTLVENCANLRKEAIRLSDASQSKNVAVATESLQRITLQVRQLKARVGTN